MKIENIEQALKYFENSAIENSKLLDSADYKLSNKHYKILDKCVKYLENNNALKALIPLLEHPNYGVQLWSASFLGATNKSLVISVLEKIVDLKIPHISLSAEYTLKGIIKETKE